MRHKRLPVEFSIESPLSLPSRGLSRTDSSLSRCWCLLSVRTLTNNTASFDNRAMAKNNQKNVQGCKFNPVRGWSRAVRNPRVRPWGFTPASPGAIHIESLRDSAFDGSIILHSILDILHWKFKSQNNEK